MTTTPITGAPEWAASQAAPWTPHNEALRRIESGYSRAIIVDRDLTAPPGSCADGARYLVLATGTGAWAGYDGKMAVAVGTNAANGWLFITVAVEGFRLYVQDENVEIEYNGAAWVASAGSGGALLAANNLSDVASPATARANLGVAYRFGFFFSSVPTADETLGLHVAAEALTLPANFSGSFGKIGINPTGSFVITVYQNPTFTGLLITGGTNIGTITISTGGSYTFATACGTSKSILQGEMLGFKGPTTPDATAACAAFTIEGAY